MTKLTKHYFFNVVFYKKNFKKWRSIFFSFEKEKEKNIFLDFEILHEEDQFVASVCRNSTLPTFSGA